MFLRPQLLIFVIFFFAIVIVIDLYVVVGVLLLQQSAATNAVEKILQAVNGRTGRKPRQGTAPERLVPRRRPVGPDRFKTPTLIVVEFSRGRARAPPGRALQ
jgi:hypothetical protein